MNYSKRADLKSRIKSRFKTLKNFSNTAGIDHVKVTRYFTSRMAIAKIDEFEMELENLLRITPYRGNPQEIDADDREYIRTRIVLNYHSFSQFLADNPSFSKSFLSNILRGKRVRKDQRFHRLKEAVDLLKYDASKFVA